MNSSKWIWRIVSIVSILATLLLLIGFVYAIKDIQYPQAGQTPSAAQPQENHEAKGPEAKKEIKIAAIGDSLAKGTGDNTGMGFARRTVNELAKDTGKKVILLNNLGINGLTTTGLLPKLEERGTQYVLGQADIILLSIGGNDLFQGAESAVKGIAGTSSTATGLELDPKDLLKGLPKASTQLKAILERIRAINPNAWIVYIGLYNPFGDIKDLQIPGNQAVSSWNQAALETINKNSNMMLVPTFDLFQHNLDKYLSSDHFHPNGDGYQQIAERIVQAIR
ncbi:GDSL-type esterase/lipase family protein [Paenibacillus sp. KQZ6P-2]|uniref:GDSL-type esterase/lipase family protein n=1 Tax=Paenibacillus mangrovi TaxID=2931978 RepID=A0A9X1WSN6_9BACL|nr:GDSL-type esterase/lipase family protein [Paenibacillus mangrovi]MCJ8014288.1 GDSL-type esterase/lipase family protein [Paenibacillus mangrovi]